MRMASLKLNAAEIWIRIHNKNSNKFVEDDFSV